MNRMKEAVGIELSSEFLTYLAARGCTPGERLPSIQQLADELEISTGKLREQLEVARTMGLVEVKPKTGIRSNGYQFGPGLKSNLRFALAVAPSHFRQFGELRNRVEASYWHEAVERLESGDIVRLRELVRRAWERLQGTPIQIPHEEHRELHLTIYSRLDNPFVKGILEAYWDAYEAVGLNVYADYSYLERVWRYHESMVDSIASRQFEAGYHLLIEHIDLLQDRTQLQPYEPVSADGLAQAS